MGLGSGIWVRDWVLGYGFGIGFWDMGLGLGFGIWVWDWVSGIWVWDWVLRDIGLGLDFWDIGLGLGLGLGYGFGVRLHTKNMWTVGPCMDFPARICGPYGPYMVFLQEFMDIEVHI